MKKPIDQKTEVLYSLLTEGQQGTLDLVAHGVCNPTSVITKLRQYGVDIVCDSIQHKNKFGRKIKYGKFKLANKTKAKVIYNQLTKTK
jgi:hypothetical protein